MKYVSNLNYVRKACSEISAFLLLAVPYCNTGIDTTDIDRYSRIAPVGTFEMN